jgi:hypothetical protein
VQAYEWLVSRLNPGQLPLSLLERTRQVFNGNVFAPTAATADLQLRDTARLKRYLDVRRDGVRTWVNRRGKHQSFVPTEEEVATAESDMADEEAAARAQDNLQL